LLRKKQAKGVTYARKLKPISIHSAKTEGPHSKGNIRRGPGRKWEGKPAVIVRRDGKEVCNLKTSAGWAEYKWRIVLMWVRQDGICCNCWLELKLSEATFEHEDGRGAGRRDDRIAIFDEEGRFVRHLNGASHEWCNHKRGSRRTQLWHGNNCVIEASPRLEGVGA
jgi:hypothetical protein